MHQRNYLFINVLFVMVTGIAFSCNSGQSTAADDTTVQKIQIKSPEHITNAVIDSTYPPVDRSPMDMSYFPVDFPMLKMNGVDTAIPVMRVIYSRPQKNGRMIFGNDSKSLCQYGKQWRLGANEATEIEFFKPVTIHGKKIAPGRYILYCIPFEDKWVIILNNNLFTWGLHIDTTKDILKTEVPVTNIDTSIEFFTMNFQPSASGANLVMAWDSVKAVLPVSF